MERTDTLTKIISLLLFFAMLAYMGVYLIRSAGAPIRTAPAVRATVTDSADANGIVVREETVITSSDTYVDCTAGDGQRVSAGTELAVAYSSEAALERANRIRELELEISRLKTLLPDLATEDDLSARDSAVRSAILRLSAAVADMDLSELDSASLSLRTLVYDSQTSDAAQSDLSALEREMNSLMHSSTSDISTISAPAAGIFTTVIDGFEGLSLEDVLSCSPQQLWELMKTGPETNSAAVGKLITDYDWYFASVMDAEDAARLKTSGTVYLNFGRYYDGSIPARVVTVSLESDGECAVIFSCSQALTDTVAMRQVSAEVIFSQHSGIRVPAEAVHYETGSDGTQSAWVYTVTGLQAEKKYVDVIYETGDFLLVSGSGADALREGNEIIVSGQDIYDGKVLN